MTSIILLCTDGSELALKAAREGLDRLREPTELIVASVVQEPHLALPYDASGMAGAALSVDEAAALQEDMAAAGQDAVDRTVAAIGREDATKRVITGDAGRALVALAEEVGATTLVIGSRGHGGLKRAVLGSVSDHVVRNSPCPVLVAHTS
jgi:nucleotide-binding universal stress UspA family protein